MNSLNIWVLAQALNSIAAFYLMGSDCTIAIIFAFTCGIPALIMMSVLLRILRKSRLNGLNALIISLLLMPVFTGLCSFTVSRSLDGRGDLDLLAWIAVAATFVSTLVFSKGIMRSMVNCK